MKGRRAETLIFLLEIFLPTNSEQSCEKEFDLLKPVYGKDGTWAELQGEQEGTWLRLGPGQAGLGVFQLPKEQNY